MKTQKQITMMLLVGLVLVVGTWKARDLLTEPEEAATESYEETAETSMTQEGQIENRNSKVRRIKASLMSDKITRLEQRLDALSADQKEDADTREEESAEGKETNTSPMDLGPSAEEFLATLSHTFEAQTYDADWAPGAASTLTADFGDKAESFGFKLNGVECRDNGCKATLEFASYDDALEKSQALAMGRYSLPCATGISVPEPEDTSRDNPYTASVFFENCDKSNAIM
jgi:hypothetical protein